MTDELEELRQHWTRLESKQADSPRQRSVLREECNRLHDAAYALYKQRQIDAARSLFHRAYEAAVKAGDRAMELDNLYWEGHCLRWSGQLRAALACLLQLEGGVQENKERYFYGLVEQIRIAILLPLSLDSIFRLIDRCYREMTTLGLTASRGMLLIVECYLARDRYDEDEELAKAQEAMSAYEPDSYPDYDCRTYYSKLIYALLDNKRRIEAEQWLERYEGLETKFEMSKELDLLYFRRRMALEDGDYPTAWGYAQRLLQRAREGERSPEVGLKAYCETAIQCGHLSYARNALAELLARHRNSEIGQIRYALRRLAGDYHRAVVQRFVEKAEESGKSRISLQYEQGGRRHFLLARRYYGYAMKIGQFLDGKLQCDWRQREIEERLVSLADIDDAITKM